MSGLPVSPAAPSAVPAHFQTFLAFDYGLKRTGVAVGSRMLRTANALGTIRAEGEVRWIDGREIVFTSSQMVHVQARWRLDPAGDGTDATVTLRLDLSPMLGPLAALIPPQQVEAIAAPDLDSALDALARRVNG